MSRRTGRRDLRRRERRVAQAVAGLVLAGWTEQEAEALVRVLGGLGQEERAVEDDGCGPPWDDPVGHPLWDQEDAWW